MAVITYKKIMNQRKLREIFKKSPTELLLDDLKYLPEYKHIIENILKERGV